MTGELQPLAQNFRIVDENGFPTPYFIRWAQQRQIDITGSINAAQAQQLIDDWAAARHVAAGTGLAGGGALSADVTLELDAGLINLNDIDFSTPPTNGQLLKYDAASSKWKPASGGGGGGGGGQLVPYPPSGVSVETASVGNSVNAMILIPVFCNSATPVNGIYVPIVYGGSGHVLIPAIYGNVDPLAALPAISGSTLVATGAPVAISSNKIHYLPLSAPYTPTVGNWYWVGVTLSGGSADTLTFGATGAGIFYYYFITGSFNPAPNPCPTPDGHTIQNAIGVWTA